MIINNVKLVLENEVVHGSLEMQDGKIRAFAEARVTCQKQWTAKAAGCYRG